MLDGPQQLEPSGIPKQEDNLSKLREVSEVGKPIYKGPNSFPVYNNQPILSEDTLCRRRVLLSGRPVPDRGG